MLVTAATDLQKDIVEGGRVSWCHPKDEIAGQAQIFCLFIHQTRCRMEKMWEKS